MIDKREKAATARLSRRHGLSPRHPKKATVNETPEERRNINAAGQSEQEENGADRLAELGDRLYKQHAAELEQQHFGQYVIFNIENGKFVVGGSHLEAIKAYRAEHGPAAGWCRGIGFLSRV